MQLLQSFEFPNLSPYSARNVSGFLNLITIDILGWIFLHCGGLSWALSMFSSIPGLYPLDANSISRCYNQECLDVARCLPLPRIIPVEND